ncbi:alpha/beta fold hydrolase [Streptomyces sp. CSDS2]|uniref:alpha/beta fold hydrolase n=1 Tax=Streptomyces sp. CSDS2 TaxID=3055051 RepID=UPI0025B0FFF6|nr:alpha/beta fold hydrolase [Streptomyces sp. CSDS2]MDN3260920.1 alpha/beta fold hydrolase [Streptomyces sp. CSDS2]
MQTHEIAVEEGTLRLVRFGEGDRLVIAVHGILGSLMTWAPVAAALPEGHALLAMDLRGHGHSYRVPGPYGLDRLSDDVLAVVDRFGGPDTVLAGHSMGGTIAALVGAQRSFRKVVMIDGGLPLPVPEDADAEQVMQGMFGQAIARLGQTFPSLETYRTFFLDHPVFAGWRTEGSERYADYDALNTAAGFRSRVREDAVRENGRWLASQGGAIAAALEKVSSPLVLLRASRGRLDEPGGMIREEVAAEWRRRLPGLHDEVLDDCNHYSVLFDPRCVERIAAVLTG